MERKPKILRVGGGGSKDQEPLVSVYKLSAGRQVSLKRITDQTSQQGSSMECCFKAIHIDNVGHESKREHHNHAHAYALGYTQSYPNLVHKLA